MFKKIFKSNRVEEIVSFMDGEIISLNEVKDELFSQKMLGDGFAIIPSTGEVASPMSGTITVVFPTGHAFGITRNDGVEVLIHLGLDTVAYEGKGFEPRVKEGQKVKQGDLLGSMDLDFFKSENVDTTSMLVFTSGNEVELLIENDRVIKGQPTIIKLI